MVLDLFPNLQNNFVHSNPQMSGGTGPKNPEIMKMQAFEFSHNEIEKSVVPNEAESSYGAFSNALSINSQYKCPNNANESLNDVRPLLVFVFHCFSLCVYWFVILLDCF